MSDPKECPPDKILNPKTNRCVNRNGVLGKKLVAEAKAKVAKKSNSPKSLPRTKSSILKNLIETCNNDYEPILMENFSDMSEEDLKLIVHIGEGSKKNCYHIDTIYEIYKNAVLSKKPAKDPMNPSYTLSENDIKLINKTMKLRDPKYKSPKYTSPRAYPRGWDLIIDMETNHAGIFFHIRVKKETRTKFDLGLVPGWIEINHTGSSDYTTGVLLTNIRELWDKKKLLSDDLKTCHLNINYNYTYWLGSTWKQRFIDLCEVVKEKLQE
jgi:hypothetical protein